MLIILDRDGVINQDSDAYIKSPEEWLPIPNSLVAIAKLNQAGHKVVIATNQSGVGRGYYSEATLADIHAKLECELALAGGHIDGIFYCPHHPDDGCDCRKPKAGLLEQIAIKFPTDFSDAILVGDSLRDIQAAQAVNCKAVLVRTGKGNKTLQANIGLENVPIYDDLWEFVADILALRDT